MIADATVAPGHDGQAVLVVRLRHENGAFDFIGKPFDIVELREKVAGAFAHVAQNFPSSLQER